MDIQELYESLSISDVELEEIEHIYLDDKGVFYNSVTGVLSLIKSEFDSDSVIEGLIRQYNTFIKWYYRVGGKKEELPYYISLYVNYRQFTPWEYAMYEGEQRKTYNQKIHDFVNIEHFKNVYEDLELNNTLKRKKNIYLNKDFTIMSKSQIKEMWKNMTDIANHYGNIVHLTLERYLLYYQGIKFNDTQYEAILNHYLWITSNINNLYSMYPHSKHSFYEYEINVSLSELMKHVEDCFMKLNLNLGRCVVPEKRLLYKKLAGTSDVYVDIDNFNFGLGDHKTNKDFSLEDPYEQKLLMPGNYDNSHFNLYRFQMNIYAYMIEQLYNKKMNFLYITYYNRQTSNFKVYDMPYEPHEAEWLIENYLTWVDRQKTRLLSSSLGDLIKNSIKEEWMDHFAKNMVYFVKVNKGKTDSKIYSDYIINYRNKFINYPQKKM